MFDLISGRLRRTHSRIGTWGWVEAILYVLLVPPYIARSWVLTLWASRRLLLGQWGRYHGFHPRNALNSFFYKTQWLNLERYGRNGVSPIVGLGAFPLRRWFHLSLLSSCLYANAGAATTVIGTIAWAAAHLVWLDSVAWVWGCAVTAVLLFSSTAFAMAFVRQNYNILGWMWLPLALYAISTAQWALAALVWLAASMASITVIFAALPLMFVLSAVTGQWECIFSLLPALAKLLLHFVSMLRGEGAQSPILDIAKVIGLTKAGVRYKRTSMRLGMVNTYLIVIYSIACGMIWLGQAAVPYLLLVAASLFVLNQRLIRFADDQSVILLFVTICGATVLQGAPSVLSFLGMLLAANPLPLSLGLTSTEREGSLIRVPSLSPFNHEQIYAAISRFFEQVPKSAKVYIAFEDPEGVYERIFDGYRNLLELPLFVAAERGIHMFPDWHAVSETNYEGAPVCWGRTPEAVLDNVRRWQAGYVVVYQDAGTELAGEWRSLGFLEKASFDWFDWKNELRGVKLWRAAHPPKWWLLQVPSLND